MDLKTALKLQKLRKEHGYSQEELADRLGVSRQAVSKWERAEASPDTDNLICLAKLYKTSLDELLEIEIGEKSSCEKDGVRDLDARDVAAAKNCVTEHDDDEQEDLDEADCEDEDCDEPTTRIGKIIHSVTPLVAAIIFILLGGIWGLWHPSWIVFFSIPLVSTLALAIEKRRFCAFAYPVFATAVYLSLGCIWGLWHPSWVIFTTIPIYYVIFGSIDKSNRSKGK